MVFLAQILQDLWNLKFTNTLLMDVHRVFAYILPE